MWWPWVVEKKCIYILSSQDVQDIYSAIKSAFKNTNLEHLLSKIVFLGSDGASVNTDIKYRLITNVGQETPSTFTWCLAKRFDLALKDALKE